MSCAGDETATPDPSTDSGTTEGSDVITIESTVDTSVPCDACDGLCVEETMTYLEVPFHSTDELIYADTPPTGGIHDPCWATWGVHDDLDPRNWVHNLEHGGVVVLYDCPEGCDDEVAQLATYLEGREETMILAPYEGLSSRFAAVSWGVRLLVDCVDEATLDTFVDAHFDQAPESVLSDPSAACM